MDALQVGQATIAPYSSTPSGRFAGLSPVILDAQDAELVRWMSGAEAGAGPQTEPQKTVQFVLDDASGAPEPADAKFFCFQ
ncbi:hypothetical protein SS50377_23958 [Spironucleus salmonicida]|nr:hypothetical protein SS50377_23949 [Spironucleus salmonicida]KAH0574022.1 hypothetical protein SS50377_23958 [Spironucleus salmonicida]|eukprot:EST48341.1 Hypothetical protein SS50377_11548 [Spironucleus salmonicida]